MKKYVYIKDEKEMQILIDKKVLRTSYGYIGDDKRNEFPTIFKLCISHLSGMQIHLPLKNCGKKYSKWVLNCISVNKYLNTKHCIELQQQLELYPDDF